MMCLRIKANNRKGYSLVREGGVFDISYVTSRTRRGRVQGNMGGVSPALTAASSESIVYIEFIKIWSREE